MTEAGAHTPPFSIQGGSVILGGDPVLQDVNLTVDRGEFLALLGGNGSGKTTLLRVLLGLLPLTAGQVDVFGVPAARFRDWSRIAYVPQHLLASSAVPVSVAEVVAAGVIGPRTFWLGRQHARTRECLEEVDLWERRKHSFHDLSGGQQRRVMIAAALTKKADVLLLDEPTAGVDAQSVAHLEALLSRLKQRGTTVVLVTHELGSLQHMVDHCVVLGTGPENSVLYDGSAPAPRGLRDPAGHHDHDELPDSPWEFRP